MSFKLYNPAQRIALAFFISLLLHGLLLWGPNIRLPQFKSSLPPLTAKLEALPGAGPAKPKPKRKRAPAVPKTAPEPAPQAAPPPPENPLAQSSPAVAADALPASAALAAETLATEPDSESERPPLPKRAQLTFSIHKGEGGFRVGEAVHTLEIEDGRYTLHSEMKTVGLVRLFKTYELSQYSSGSYTKYGLQPQQFMEERIEKAGTQRSTVDMDFTAQLARFSHGGQTTLPPDTQDILSVMYQFPPLANTEIATVSVCNGKKIETYRFEISNNELIDTGIGKLPAVKLHKMNSQNEEGLDIWLAREYRLFPVKIRYYERNGDIAGEAVITDIRVSEEEGVRSDAVN